ncbi:hypothetical protein [Flavobacterium sp.]|uniref:hypothetical protein n=1 Tax=Flavobacterium sp. TaxID=239 RepID=UPI0037504587
MYKKLKSKNSFKKLALIVMISSIILGCSSDQDPVAPPYTNVDTSFQSLFNTVQVNQGLVNDQYMDTEVHQYSFKMTKSGKIYSVGFQSLPINEGLFHKIEIVDNVTGTIIYNESHKFSSASVDYYEINPPLEITANNSYSIRETFLLSQAPSGFFNDLICNGLRKPNNSSLTFPINAGDMIITGTNNYQLFAIGSPQINYFLPFIDFSFTPN